MSFLRFLCDELYMDKSEIIKFALTSPHRYKFYEIPKRNSNKTRTIAHPSKELKFVQRATISYLSDKLHIHESAYAYKKGLSIKDNAKTHLGTRYLLKMDFKDFFPTITPFLFFALTEKSNLNFDELDKMLLKNILFHKMKRNSSLTLSIGAPSSPLISNFIMYMFDEEIKGVCNKEKVNYTRYADDLAFSTNSKNLLFKFPKLVAKLLNKNTFGKIKINSKKTVFSSKRHNRHITGITLSNNNSLSIGRERKRLISSMIHKYVNNLLDDQSIMKLQGLFSFAAFVEPTFHERMCVKYGTENIIKLIKDRSV